MNYRFSRAFEIIEWLELNRILGAERFVVYNYSSEYNVRTVLEHYTKLGVVEVIQWPIPLIVDTWPPSTTPQIHYFGQLAVLQDCLYRNKGESEFVINVDLDEFIIPRDENVSTFSQLISSRPQTACAYVFQNAFYRKEWNDTTDVFPKKTVAKDYHLVTLLKTKRENTVLRHGQRSKFIARTSKVDHLHVHSVPKCVSDNVPSGVALLHHYRNWLKYNYPEAQKLSDPIVVTKYADELTARVSHVWKNFKDVPLDLHTTD